MKNCIKLILCFLLINVFNSCTNNIDELSEDTFLKNGDFEAGKEEWIFFSNRGTVEIDNVLSYGKGSSSVKIVANGASNPGIKQERIGIGVVKPGDNIQISFDHIGSIEGEGGLVNLLLFIERAEGEQGDPITHIFEPRPSLSETWSNYNKSFVIPDNAIVTGGISILIESVCGGAPGCIVNANIDNVTISINP